MIEQKENISKKHKLHLSIKIIYWLSFIVLIFVFIEYISLINHVKVNKELMFVTYNDGKKYDLKTSGNYSIGSTNNGETVVIDLATGTFVNKSFFLISDNDELLKITPHNIINAKPDFFSYLFARGISEDKKIAVNNPPVAAVILLILVFGIIAHLTWPK